MAEIPPIAETERAFQEIQDVRNSCKSLLKNTQRYTESAKTHSIEQLQLSEELNSICNADWAKSTDVGKYLRYFGTTIKAIGAQQEKMAKALEQDIVSPLSNFVDYDFLEAFELKKKVGGITQEYEATCGKIETTFANKKKKSKSSLIDEKQVQEFEKELERLRAELDDSTLEFHSQVSEIQSKKETKVLRYMLTLLQMQYEYHQKSFKLLSNLRPKIMSLQEDLDKKTGSVEIGELREGHLLHKTGGGWQKNYFVLKGGYLHSYKGKKDSSTLDMSLTIMLCTTRLPMVPGKAREISFEICTPDKKKPILLQAESQKERDQWVQSIQAAISASLNANTTDGKKPKQKQQMSNEDTLAWRILQRVPGNMGCADCGAPEPDWASINLGILLCLECSGVHRSLGVHISKVRSMTLDTRAWQPELLWFMKHVGNNRFNKVYESNRSNSAQLHIGDDRATREQYIRSKYQDKAFISPSSSTIPHLSQELYDTITNTVNEPLRLLRLLALGAEINWVNAEDEGKQPLHNAVIFDKVMYVEMLIQNGADIFGKETRNWTPMHYAAYYHRTQCASLINKHGFHKQQLQHKDWQNKTAIELALNGQADDIVTILRGDGNIIVGMKIEDLIDQEDADHDHPVDLGAFDSEDPTSEELDQEWSSPTSAMPLASPVPAPVAAVPIPAPIIKESRPVSAAIVGGVQLPQPIFSKPLVAVSQRNSTSSLVSSASAPPPMFKGVSHTEPSSPSPSPPVAAAKPPKSFAPIAKPTPIIAKSAAIPPPIPRKPPDSSEF